VLERERFAKRMKELEGEISKGEEHVLVFHGVEVVAK
jgi:hypothetical protein